MARTISDGRSYGIATDLVPTLDAATGVASLLVVTTLSVILAGRRLGRMDLS